MVVLRDVDGLSGQEVCDVLDISEANQRVLCTAGEVGCASALKTSWGACEDVLVAQRAGLSGDGRADHRLPGGALTRSQHERFEAHLAGCEHCTEYLRQMRVTIQLTGRLQAEDLTPGMREELTDIYRRWRSESD